MDSQRQEKNSSKDAYREAKRCDSKERNLRERSAPCTGAHCRLHEVVLFRRRSAAEPLGMVGLIRRTSMCGCAKRVYYRATTLRIRSDVDDLRLRASSETRRPS